MVLIEPQRGIGAARGCSIPGGRVGGEYRFRGGRGKFAVAESVEV